MPHVILITEPEDYAKEAIALYRSLGNVFFLPKIRKNERAKIFSRTTILVIGLKYHIDTKFLADFPQLHIVAWPGTGLNHIDTAELTERGIELISLRGREDILKDIPSTAEQTFALMLGVLRKIPWAFDDVKRGKWDRMQWRGHELKDKLLGLYGFGRLGKLVARYAHAFGMHCIAYDPHVSRAAMAKENVRKVERKALFRTADILSLHALLTDESRNSISANDLKSMKWSAVLINTARAELIERGALRQALEQQWIAGAGIDVLWGEETKTHLKSRLLTYAKMHDNLLISPHIGGATYEAMAKTQIHVAELVEHELHSH